MARQEWAISNSSVWQRHDQKPWWWHGLSSVNISTVPSAKSYTVHLQLHSVFPPKPPRCKGCYRECELTVNHRFRDKPLSDRLSLCARIKIFGALRRGIEWGLKWLAALLLEQFITKLTKTVKVLAAWFKNIAYCPHFRLVLNDKPLKPQQSKFPKVTIKLLKSTFFLRLLQNPSCESV